jgi:hypothetical protein
MKKGNALRKFRLFCPKKRKPFGSRAAIVGALPWLVPWYGKSNVRNLVFLFGAAIVGALPWLVPWWSGAGCAVLPLLPFGASPRFQMFIIRIIHVDTLFNLYFLATY